MSRRLKIALGAAAALVLAVAVGASGAIAVSRALDGDRSQAVIEDAAGQLGIEPEALSDALEQALENRVEEAVESGRLTEEQGERLKERLRSGAAPLFGGFGFGGQDKGLERGLGHLRVGASLEAAAEYLGLTPAELRERLRDGDTLAEVAEDEEKSVDGLVQALVAEAESAIEEAVDSGRLSEERGAELQDGLEERVTELVNGELRLRGFGRPFRGGFWFQGGGPPPFAGPRG